ncbi:hypothetical protein LUW77_26665 [Streptomyces radiopugnans]|nr:hypothetical protein LUW77_26665 [Streptomyces radiopugnans]
MTPSAPPDDEQGRSGQTAEQAAEQAAGQPLLPLAYQTPPCARTRPATGRVCWRPPPGWWPSAVRST